MLPVVADPIPSQIFVVDNFTFKQGTMSDLFIEIYNDPDENAELPIKYKMRRPAPYKVSDNFSTLLTAFGNFAGQRVVHAFGIDEEIDGQILRDFGFDQISARITFDLMDPVSNHELVFVREYDFIFSKKNENGNYYVLSLDYGSIVEVTPEMLVRPGIRLPFTEWDLLKFVDKYIFRQNVNEVSSILIKFPGEEDVLFELEGKGPDLVVRGNGAILDTPNFRSFYITALSLELIDYGNDVYENDDLLVLEMIITEHDGFECHYKFYFVEGNTSRSFYRLNGAGDFYVEYDRVLKLWADTNKMLSGEWIDRDARD
jgi:hypothetical protein